LKNYEDFFFFFYDDVKPYAENYEDFL